MIDDDLKARIIRLHLGEKWKVSTIAHHLQVHHSTVKRALYGAAVEVPSPQRARMVECSDAS